MRSVLVMEGKLKEVEIGESGTYDWEIGGQPLCFAIDELVVPKRNKKGEAVYGKVTLVILFHDAEERQ